MEIYDLSDKVVKDSIKNPDKILNGYAGRLIAQKNINHYMLRVVYEEIDKGIVIVTVYPTKKERY